MDHANNAVDRERLLAELVRRDEGRTGESTSLADETTVAALKADLDTLIVDLRQPAPFDAFEDESGCRRAVELAEQAHSRSGSGSRAAPTESAAGPAVERVGPYQIKSELGRGGMGAVYRAIHDKLKRDVAVKVLPATRMTDAVAVARFEREMEAIGALSHPNIVTAHDAGEVEGMHYLVMECVEGLDLAALVRRAGPLGVADACEIIRQAAQGLKAAYDRGIVHRDIKPSNLMLAQGTPDHPAATVKVLDFGLARLAPLHAELEDLTNSGQIMGTLKYMAPEQCSQSHSVDVRADIYSLGATLYKLLCGASPFSDERFDSPLALLAALGSEEPPRLAARRGDVPPKLESIVHRMMAKKPADRFASPSEVIDALAPWTAGANLAALLTQARDVGPRPQGDALEKSRPLGQPAVAGGPTGGAKRRLPVVVVLLGVGALLVAAGILLATGLLNDSSPASSVPLVSSDPTQRGREVAEWLLPRANEIEVTTSGDGFVALQLPTREKLPDDFIQLITANLDENQAFSDDDMARFDKLPLFTSLSIGGTKIGDAGLRHLGQLPLLQMLFLSETAVTDASLDQLQRYPKLEVLHLTGTQVTDAGLESLSVHAMLFDLSLVDCNVTDDGLKHLTGLKRLQILALDRTGVTPRGIATIQRSLPDCEIRSDFSAEEIAEALQSLPKVLTQPEVR